MTIYKRKNKPFKRNITEYQGNAKCDYCQTELARYTFSSGKLCCQSIASNCPSVRKNVNRNIAQKLRNELDDNGVPKLKAKALKGANTKRTTIDSEGKSILDRYSEKMRDYISSTVDDNGRTKWSRVKLSDEDFLKLPERERYHSEVWAVTGQNFKQYKHLIDGADLRGNDFHLDHIFSISEGFRNDIPAYIIGHVTNLRILPSSENCSKQGKCHKTIDQLYEDFNGFVPGS